MDGQISTKVGHVMQHVSTLLCLQRSTTLPNCIVPDLAIDNVKILCQPTNGQHPTVRSLAN